MQAGRTLVTGGATRADDGAVADLRRMGIDVTEEDLGLSEGIWPWHLEAVRAVQVAMTQWRVASTMERVIRTGLDYVGARAAWDLAGIEMTPELFEDIQTVERGALKAMREAAT